jgi:hypothetical protein
MFLQDFEEFSNLLLPENDLCSHGNGQDDQKCIVDSKPDAHFPSFNEHDTETSIDNNQEDNLQRNDDEDYDLILHEEDEESELEGFDWDEGSMPDNEDVTIATILPRVEIVVTKPHKAPAKLTEEHIVKNKPGERA